ncbi:hypothetical protein RSOLAG1IB_01347 [Rhizoctonia solani AG-1 IB]|uniref:DUF3835 domain-containing protein n=1 Tax=Thanatephorus cucumeris (strain AG1-IB / isolate 7/3/14) TaxID=1108050 RepID=A0A0B7FGJ9_THACB|nr:hypothetical protein RSOLAG1IB_01347 [Rhizoctonia solani AG-1 IB]
MSTTTPEGEAHSIGVSKREALRALLNSLVPNGQMTIPDDTNVNKLAEKLDELLASKGGLDAYTNIPRDEQGRPLNEEGLPIMEIIEPVSNVNESSATQPPADIASLSISATGQAQLSPLPNWALSPAALAARRRERDRILDMLEREEEEEFAREAVAAVTREPTNRDLAVPHSVPTTPPRTLDQAVRTSNPSSRPTTSLPISSSNEESSRNCGDSVAPTSQEPLTTRKPKKQKSVSFVDPPSNDRDDRPHTPKPELDWGDVIPVRLDSRKLGPAKGHGVMKDLVVERPIGQLGGVPNRTVDSDDEDDGEGDEELNETHDVPEDEDSETDVPKEALGQLETSDDESDMGLEDPTQTVDIDDTDFDEAMLQREIALAYYARRNQIGGDITSGPLYDPMATDRNPNHGEGEDRSDEGIMETNSSRFRGSRLPGDPQTLINSAVQFGRLVDGELVVDDIAGKEVEASVEALTGGDVTDQEDMTEKTIELLRRGDTYGGDDSASTKPKRSTKYTPKYASGNTPTVVFSGSRPPEPEPGHPRSAIKQQDNIQRASPRSNLATSLSGRIPIPGRVIPPPPTVDQPMIIESGFGFDPAFQVAPPPKPSVAKAVAPMSQMVKERIAAPSPKSVAPKKISRFAQVQGPDQPSQDQSSTSPMINSHTAPITIGSDVLERAPTPSGVVKHPEAPKRMSRFRAERSGWM